MVQPFLITQLAIKRRQFRAFGRGKRTPIRAFGKFNRGINVTCFRGKPCLLYPANLLVDILKVAFNRLNRDALSAVVDGFFNIDLLQFFDHRG